MTTILPTGSYNEPILISDEEDAAFVENELSRWTDSSSSNHNTPPYNPFSFTPSGSPPPSVAQVSGPAAASGSSGAVYGQKRKWTDMREASISTQPHSDHVNNGKKKKKQRKDKQRANLAAASSSASKYHQRRTYPHSATSDATSGAKFGDSASYPPFDFDAYSSYSFGYEMPAAPYHPFGTSYVPPEDEYRPTDGPLWNPSERPSALSALATPWYPDYSSSSMYPIAEPMSSTRPLDRSLSPPASHLPAPAPAVSSTASILPPQPISEHQTGAPLSDLPSLLSHPQDTSLSDRLRQLEALSASLLALTGGSSGLPESSRAPEPIITTPFPTTQPPIHRPKIAPPLEHPPPPRNQGEPLKRQIGVLDDKGNNGFFDLSAPNLEPIALSSPIQPVRDFTLVMAQLPKRFRKVEFVTSWARRHGTPVRVVLDAKSGKALVEWVGIRAADNAFGSMRLRGDGREHIRVYKYRGDKPAVVASVADAAAAADDKEIEEGEIEEGEVVEAPTKSKKKKNKGKKKAPQLEQRLADAAAPAIAPLPHFLPLRPSDSLVAVLDSSSHDASSAAVPVSRPSASPSSSRPTLGERLSDPPAVRARDETREEEMELESDDEVWRASALSPSQSTLPVVTGDKRDYGEEDMEIENDDDGRGQEADVEEDDDMDMDTSSTPEPSPLLADPPDSLQIPAAAAATTPALSPSPPRAAAAPPPPEEEQSALNEIAQPSVIADDTVAHEAEEALAIKAARRQKLEEAIARTKAELAMRAVANSSRTSLVSSTGSSESPEPVTPLDSPILNYADVAIASSSHPDPLAVDHKPAAAGVVIKTEAGVVDLDDLATSFITETIHAAAVSPRFSPPAHSAAAVPPSMPKSTAASVFAPGSATASAPTPGAVQTSITIALTEEQRQQKQKRWLELVSTSKTLFGKIAAAKTKEEKDLLMRLLRAKTKAADELKHELDSGVVVVYVNPPAPAPAADVTKAVDWSATPTPVPSSRMSSSTPTPTPTGTSTPTLTVPQKTSPAPRSRFPETVYPMYIDLSDDDEADC